MMASKRKRKYMTHMYFRKIALQCGRGITRNGPEKKEANTFEQLGGDSGQR